MAQTGVSEPETMRKPFLLACSTRKGREIKNFSMRLSFRKGKNIGPRFKRVTETLSM